MPRKFIGVSPGIAFALALSACTVAPPLPDSRAIVTGITEGHGGEKTYLLRTPAGRTYIVTQALVVQPKVGDVVELEASAAKGLARIKVR